MFRKKLFGFPRRRSLRQCEKGSTVVEFALVIVPFLACMFAIIEIGLVFFAGQVLETSVADAGRMILTGQVQNAKFDANGFKNQICTSSVQALFKCDDIKIDVRTVGSFGGADLSPPVNPQTNLLDTSDFTYQPGDQCQIVVVRVVYEWPTFVRGFGLDLATLANGKHLLMSTAAFRNEPYSGTGFC
ncbi:MAG TPA: TadE/TadG family type IV pilus assembly protein [Xanthobacteraceae bacterium]|jgi:Flp pilus assembly protein TadG|nr:TadE/TadG family type IV pilus assembly protein [Xanthobacteraceae bacterium]